MLFISLNSIIYFVMITGKTQAWSKRLNAILFKAFAFKKFDYEDGLSFKTLLNDEELMVTKRIFRSLRMPKNFPTHT